MTSANSVKAAATPDARETLLNAFAGQVYMPYMIMAALLALLAVWIARSNLPDIMPAAVNERSSGQGCDWHAATGIASHPHLWLGVVCLFLYVGVEVMAGDAIGVYGPGFDLPLERHAVVYLVHAVRDAGRLCRWVADHSAIRISATAYLALSAALGVVLTLAAYVTSGYTSVAFIASTRVCECDDVASDFPARHSRPWPAYRNRLGVADHGHCRRRVAALRVRGSEAEHRFSTGLRAHRRAEVFVYFVLRAAGASGVRVKQRGLKHTLKNRTSVSP